MSFSQGSRTAGCRGTRLIELRLAPHGQRTMSRSPAFSPLGATSRTRSAVNSVVGSTSRSGASRRLASTLPIALRPGMTCCASTTAPVVHRVSRQSCTWTRNSITPSLLWHRTLSLSSVAWRTAARSIEVRPAARTVLATSSTAGHSCVSRCVRNGPRSSSRWESMCRQRSRTVPGTRVLVGPGRVQADRPVWDRSNTGSASLASTTWPARPSLCSIPLTADAAARPLPASWRAEPIEGLGALATPSSVASTLRG